MSVGEDLDPQSAGKYFIDFVANHLPGFNVPDDPIVSFEASADYAVKDTNAFFPINKISFCAHRDSSIDYDLPEGTPAPTFYLIQLFPEVTNQSNRDELNGPCWEVRGPDDCIGFYFNPGGEMKSEVSHEAFVRVVGRIALFEDSGQLTRLNHNVIVGDEKAPETEARIIQFSDLVRQRKLARR